MYPRLKELREEKKYTLRDMGELLGVSYQAYSNYENGHREPSISILEKISSIYDVSIDYIPQFKNAKKRIRAYLFLKCFRKQSAFW